MSCFSALASNQTAWTQTKGLPGFVNAEPPVNDLLWATTALAGATSWFHMDADGFATAIDPHAGTKYWVVARPDAKHRDKLQTTDSFKGFDPTQSNVDGYEHEAILLTPGMAL